jgi:hypothetical protein
VGPIHCPETSVKDNHSTLRNIPERRCSHQHRGGSLKSLVVVFGLTPYSLVSGYLCFRGPYCIFFTTNPEDVGGISLRNFGDYISDYTVSQPVI